MGRYPAPRRPPATRKSARERWVRVLHRRKAQRRDLLVVEWRRGRTRKWMEMDRRGWWGSRSGSRLGLVVEGLPRSFRGWWCCRSSRRCVRGTRSPASLLTKASTMGEGRWAQRWTWWCWHRLWVVGALRWIVNGLGAGHLMWGGEWMA